ncbi:MAG: hypothetical protein AAFQ94_18730, partial [Bacteroidota bacterium]
LIATIFNDTDDPVLSDLAVLSADVTICSGGAGYPNGQIEINEANISGSGPFSYEYYFGNSALSVNLIEDGSTIFDQKSGAAVPDAVVVDGSNSSLITGLNEGVYTVVAISETTGCRSVPLTINLFENTEDLPLAISALTDETFSNSVCDINVAGGPTSYNGQITVVPTDGSVLSDYSFTWFDGADILLTNQIAGITSNVLANVRGGTYTVIATNRNTNCQTTLQHTISDEATVPEFFDVASAVLPVDVSICRGGTGYPNGGIFIDLTEITGYQSNVDYAVKYFYGTSAVPSYRLTTDNTADIFTQKGESDVSINSNVNEITNGELTGLNAGKYTVTVLDLRTGCESLPVTVEVGDDHAFPEFTSVITDNTVCDFSVSTDYNGSISLSTTSGSVSDYAFDWYAGQSTASSASIPTSAVTSAEVNAAGNILTEIPGGVYTVVITDVASQCSSQIEITVADDLTDFPVADLIVSDLTTCEGNIDFPNGAVTVSNVSGGSGNYAFEWYAGTSVNSAKLLSDGDNIFTVTGKPGNIGANGSISFTNGGAIIDGLSEGTYTLRVLDTQTGCTSSLQQFNVIADQPPITGLIVKNADDFSCDVTNPTGQLSANATSLGFYAYEWYRGNSATGTILGTNSTLSGVSTGDYTVKIINEATGCYLTLTESVERIVPIVLITTAGSTTPQTICTPANASVTMQLFRPLFSESSPAGFSQNLTYEWYRGQTIEPANIINSETSETLSGVTSGFYTVIATESSSGCQSLPFTVQLTDNFSVSAPVISTSFDVIPNDCNGTDGEITGTITLVDNPTGNDFSFHWYEGSENYADDAFLGIALTSGDFLSDGTTLVTVNAPNTVSGAGPATLSGIVPGLYTLVAENLTTGCRTQEVFDLSYVDIQQTSGVTVAHIEECPDTGVISIGMEDDPTNAGFVVGDVDDIAEYKIFLYAGSGVPADRFTAYLFEGTSFPMIFDPVTGNLTDGNGTLVTSGTPLSAGDNATFSGLPAGVYTAIAREVDNPSFNPASTNQCWSLSSVHEVEKRNFEPIIEFTQTIANTVCDFVTFGGNGILNLSVRKDQGDTNPPSPDGFKCTLYNGTSNTDVVITTESFTTASASFIVNSLDPQEYLVEIERMKGTVSTGCISSVIVTIPDEPDVHEIFSASVTNQTNCSPNNAGITINDDDISINGDASIGNAADYTFSWYEESLANPIAGETGNSLSLSAFQTGVFLVTATNSSTGCSTSPFSINVQNLTVVPEVVLNVNALDSSCDPDLNEGNGEISFAIENPAVDTDYDFQWYVGTTTTTALSGSGVINGVSGTLNGSLEANYTGTLSGINGDQQYTLEVIDRSDPNNACSIVATIFVPELIEEKSLRPSLDVSITNNENCVNPNGSISIAGVFEGDLQQSVANYTFQWFDPVGTDITSSALDNGAGFDNELVNLEAGTYEVLITNNVTQCTNDQRIALVVEEVVEHPEIQLIARSNNTFCFVPSGGTGSMVIEISEGGTELTSITASDYTINWYAGSSTSAPELLPASIGGTYSNVLTGLDAGDYTVEVIKGSSYSPNAGCSLTATFRIDTTFPILSIDQDIDVIKSDNLNCNLANGAIEITTIREDGVPVAVSPTNYTFRWFDSSGNDITLFAVNGIVTAGNQNRIENLDAGNYSVIASNTVSGCTTDSFVFIINDVSENPVVQIAQLYSDSFCDNTGNQGDGQLEIEILEDGGSADLSDYTVTWYRGSTTVTTLASAIGSASIGGTNNNLLTGLSAGQYTVEVTKDNLTPNSGCVAVATFTVASESPIISLDPTLDLIIGGNQNCVDPNGFIEIDAVREDGVSIALNSNYSLEWTDSGRNPLPSANLSDAGTGNNNRAKNLSSGSYIVTITDNVTGCVSADFEIMVEDTFSNPEVQSIAGSPNTLCDGSFNTGDGILNIEIDEDGSPANLSDYTITWYRGDAVIAANEIFPNNPAMQRGSALANITNTELSELSSGFYTVVVTKSGSASPNAGCETVITFTVEDEFPVLTIDALGLNSAANTNCVNPNGFLDIASINEDGTSIAVDFTNYNFQWFDGSGVDISATAVNSTGTGNRIEDLDAGEYTVIVTNDETSCVSETIALIVEDAIEVIEVQLVVMGGDQFCDNSGNVGNGFLEISILEGGSPADLSDYTVEWYRGNGLVNQIFPVDGGTRGTAALISTTSIVGLSNGEYTVVVTKSAATSPGAGCQVIGTFTVDSDLVDVSLNQSMGIVKQANTNTTGTPNGFIEIVAVSEGGVEVAVNPTNYSFNWFDESGNEITSLAVNGTTVAGTRNRLEELENSFYFIEVTNVVTGCISDEILIYVGDPFVWSGAVDIDWNESGNWVGGVVPPATADALIPDEETIDNNPIIYREITINNLIVEEGGDLAVTGDYLLVNGSLLNDGEIFISGEQSLALMGTRLGTGRSQAFQQLRGSFAWQIIGLPITGGNYDTSNSLFFTYDNDQQEFVRKFGAPAPGEGMFVAIGREDLTGNGVDFNTGRGTLNFGEVNRDITLNSDGFNLVANPYAASIDAQAFFSNPDNVMYTTGTAYLWNDAGVNVGGLRGGDYITVNSVGAVGGPVDPGNGIPGSKSTADFDGSFNSFQGFFVEATDNGNVSFTPSMQITGDNLNGNFFRQAEQSGKILRLSLSNGKLYNDLIITLDENATLNDDYSMDARKFAGNDQLSFYSRHQEEQYAILALPSDYGTDQDVVLDMQVGAEGEYQFTVEEMLNFDEREIVMLTDQLTGVEYDLTNTKELILNLKEGLAENRFTISFRNNQITTINDNKLTGLKVYGDTEAITLHYPGINEQVTIFDLNGRKLFASTVDFSEGTAVIEPVLSTGKVYVIRVNDEVLKFRLK